MVISKLIGEGSSGCVFKPSLPCKNEKYKQNNKEVSKLVFSENYSQELKINKLIQKIQNYHTWSHTWNNSCSPSSLNYLKQISMIEDCLDDKGFKLNWRHRDNIVTGSFCGSVVAKRNLV